MTNEEKINLIGQKIVLLSNNLDKYKNELAQLQSELNALKTGKLSEKVTPVVEEQKVIQPINPVVEEIKTEPIVEAVQNITIQQPPQKPKKAALGFEETIGARWFSIIGIVVLVLGIAIGVKYAIDQNLIDETTRLVLGYLAGGIILTLALVYKKKYDVFSAILLSGAMVVMFFTTYVGYSHYHFYSAPVAFFIMTVFTAFTVYAAHIYNYEIIALIGLVGGYTIPPLLSTGSGEIQYMFGFMLVLNLGVLILSFKKYWKFVNHVAYGLSWLIFAVWMASSYKPQIYFGRTMFFATAFYLVFYLSFISYKIFRNKAFSAWDVILVLSNSLIYFGIGYNAMRTEYYEQYQGLFCVVNAIFHLGFALLCRKKEVADKTIYYFIIAMVISFITMAIPIQLDGNHVTIIWLCEMVILTWMTRKTNINTYKYLAYGITLLAFCSLWHDWSNYSYFSNNTDTTLAFKPLMNRYFLTSIIGTGVFGFVWWLNKKMISDRLSKIANVILIVFGLIVCYMTFGNEIMLYFDIQYKLSETKHIGDYGYDWTDHDSAWNSYSGLWMIIYSVTFVAVMSWFSIKKFSSTVFAYISWALSLIMVIVGLGAGFTIISDLKMEAISNYPYSQITTWNYNCRYFFLPFVALMIFMIYQFRNAEILKKIKPINFWLFHIVILIVLSDELSHIITMMHLDDYNHYSKVAYRMGYTVLWGLYSMALITYGILRERKTLRFIAISLFGLTLLKLAGDAMSMTMGYRLIVFIVIGIILLVVSFMYQKFKPLLFGEGKEEEEIENNNTADETN
ncbi:MAG TPA: DUF2339 domain-containing protein [Bacteroidia bacterium]|jgi:uncharacterized membrane protein|nr:DUF2339 domain-containing protein [Bacteroidia bacterium]